MLVSKRWRCNSIDIQAVILQGKAIERNVFINHQKIFKKLIQCRYWKLAFMDVMMDLAHGTSEFAMSWLNLELDLCYMLQQYFTGVTIMICMGFWWYKLIIFVGEELNYLKRNLYDHLGKLLKLARKAVHHLNVLAHHLNVLILTAEGR